MFRRRWRCEPGWAGFHREGCLPGGGGRRAGEKQAAAGRARAGRTIGAGQQVYICLLAIEAEVTVPGSDLTYYKTTLRHQQFLPLTSFLTFVMDGEVGIGDGYADTEDLPLTENFFAGGIRSVRGFEANTLGPRDSENEPLGGNWKAVVRNELILPVPFVEDSRSFRLTGFFDAGNVFESEIEAGEFRYSAGLSAIWISPFGVFTFSLAEPLNADGDDETQRFQFTFGTSF